MATTTVSDALVFPQSGGTGLPDETSPNSAAAFALLAEYVGGEYVRSDYGSGMGFVGHDGSNDTITVGDGVCFIRDDSSSTSNNRGSGGNAQAQSTTSSGYDTELPDNQTYMVVFPSSVTVDVSDSTLNEVWVNITDVTTDNAVEVRTGGGGGTTTTPSDTFIKLGEANPDDSSADTRANDESYPEETVVSGTVTLSSGAATVSTGVTTTPTYFDIYLDASGDGGNGADVKASARAFWDNSAGEYKVEILEDGTSVGNPDIGYRVVQR